MNDIIINGIVNDLGIKKVSEKVNKIMTENGKLEDFTVSE